MAKHTESYIDSSIETPENLPLNILATLKILEEFDKRQDAVAVVYFDKLDDLWVLAKNAIAANVMAKTDW